MRSTATLIAAVPVVLALAFAPIFHEPFSAPKTALFIVLAGSALAVAIFQGARLRGPSMASDCVLAAFVAAAWLSTAMSPQRHIAVDGAVWITAGAALYVAARAISGGREGRVLGGIAVAGVAVAVVALVQYVTRADLFALFGETAPSVGRIRLFGTLGNPNFVAAFIATSLPALLMTVRSRPVVGSIGIVSAGIAIVLTGSRAGLVAALIGVVVFAILTARKRWMLACAALAIVAVSFVIVSPQNPRAVDDVAKGRSTLWRVALSSPQSRLFGTGPATFAYHYPTRLATAFNSGKVDSRFTELERHAHNDFVEFAADLGTVGLTAFVLLALWFRHTWRRRREPIFAASIAGVLAIIALALLDFPLHRAETWALMWLWMALPLASSQRRTPPTNVRSIAAIALVGLAIVAATPALVASYWTQQGVHKETLAEYAAAADNYNRALQRHDNPDAAFGRVRALAMAGQYDEALREYEKSLRTVDEPELRLLHARILRANGQHDRAAREVRSAIARFPYSALLRDELALLGQK